jgi:hypothetical protein
VKRPNHFKKHQRFGCVELFFKALKRGIEILDGKQARCVNPEQNLIIFYLSVKIIVYVIVFFDTAIF